MKRKRSLQRETAPAREPVQRPRSVAAVPWQMADDAANGVTEFYTAGSFKSTHPVVRLLQRARHSQVGARRPAGANPTAPGGHAKGDNCAALNWATSRKPAHPGRARGALVKRASAAKAGQEWTEQLPIPDSRREGSAGGGLCFTEWTLCPSEVR